jgi:hypothetical protein
MSGAIFCKQSGQLSGPRTKAAYLVTNGRGGASQKGLPVSNSMFFTFAGDIRVRLHFGAPASRPLHADSNCCCAL